MFKFPLQTTHVVAEAMNTAGGQWTIRLIVGEEVEFTGSGLASTMSITHQYIILEQ